MSITVLCGVAGKGKTALATQLGLAAASRGAILFSNYTISWKLFGVRLTSFTYDTDYFKKKCFPGDSFIIIDEAQNDFNSRYFKDMSKEEIKYFSGHRHLGNEIVITTQHPNRIDILLRENTDKFIFIRHALPFGLKWCYEYPIADYVGKIPPEVPLPYFKRKLYRVRSSTYTKYDDKYLKDSLLTEQLDEYSYHNYKRSKFIPFPIRAYRSIRKKLGYYKKIWDLRKAQKDFDSLEADFLKEVASENSESHLGDSSLKESLT